MKWAHLKEGWRIYKRARRVRKHGFHRYPGDARETCTQIVEDCWNGTYFQTATDHGHYCCFYMRDFGWAIESLLTLGHRDRVLATLAYALEKYADQGLTTTITPAGKCIDVFRYSPDSVAYLVRCLEVAGAAALVTRYRDFLDAEVATCFERCFDPTTSLIRADEHWGSMKDSTNRNCSTYDNVMLAMLSRSLDALALPNPFHEYDIKGALRERLWNGEYFYDDIHAYPVVTGENNTFPYWTGVFTDPAMVRASIDSIRAAGLDDPFPLKYSNEPLGKQLAWRKALVSDYQTHSIKTHMGALYIHVVQEVDPALARDYTARYTAWIERHGTYLENFTAAGEPLATRFYHTDEGNLWAANYLTLL